MESQIDKKEFFKEPEFCDDFYYQSDGYILDEETYCEGGVSHKSY